MGLDPIATAASTDTALFSRVHFGALCLRSRWKFLAVIYVLRLARLGIDDGQVRAILSVANFRTAGNLLGVGRLSHIVRHDRVL